MSIKIVSRQFVGGPMDGHEQSLVESQHIYLYGDGRGHKKGEYWLDDDTGRMIHVAPEPLTPPGEAK